MLPEPPGDPAGGDQGLEPAWSSLLRVQNFTVSSDGFGAECNRAWSAPSATPTRARPDVPGPSAPRPSTTDCPAVAEAVGSTLPPHAALTATTSAPRSPFGRRNKFGPQRGPWQDDDWKGDGGGDEPPFHTPVFVPLDPTTRRPPRSRCSDTTFHSSSLGRAPPGAGVLATAASLPPTGADVRLGARPPNSIRHFLEAPHLVDTLPRRWSPRASWARAAGCGILSPPLELDDRFHRVLGVEPVPAGVVHLPALASLTDPPWVTRIPPPIGQRTAASASARVNAPA